MIVKEKYTYVIDGSEYEGVICFDDSISKPGDKVYADSDASGLWQVYEKQDPYTTKLILSPDNSTASQEFGHRIVARNDGRAVIVSAPGKAQAEALPGVRGRAAA